MSTQTSFVAEQFRLQQWANQIKDCQNRPSDMKVENDPECSEEEIVLTVIDDDAAYDAVVDFYTELD